MRPRGRIAVAEAATATLGFGAIGAVGVAQPTQWEWGFAGFLHFYHYKKGHSLV